MSESESHPIRNGIVATVVGGLILAGLLAPADKRDPVLAAVWQSLLWLLHLPFIRVTLPLWLLVLLAVGFIAIVRFLSLPLPGSVQTGADFAVLPEVPKIEPVPMDQYERAVFEVLVRADGGSVSLEQFEGATRLKRLLVLKALDDIGNRGYVNGGINYQRGVWTYSLTPKGRNEAIRAGLVK